MYWLEASVRTDGEAAEAVAEAWRPYAYSQGVALEQLGDPHSLDPLALEPEVTVKIFVPENEDTPALRHRLEEIVYYLGRLYPIPAPTFRRLQEEDWANAWKAHYHPFRVGRRLWIQPSWLAAEEAQVDDLVLTLDPGMAFGTGLHPTTQMCLQALEQLVKPGQRVLDVGTGSGILAIAAARLGAGHILAVDTDSLAVRTAMENATVNGVLGSITVRQGTLADVLEKRWDVVVVNILAPVIVSLLSHDGLLDYLVESGRLVLSGVIDQQGPEVEESLAAAGGRILDRLHVRDWLTLIATKDTITNQT